MISWKHSFKRLNEEYELAKKKKQALDNLFENGRISQATRDSFDSDINAVLVEIEKQQSELLTKMQGKTHELETQIKTLETILTNYEIQHVVGEIDEDMYQREITLLSTGLEGARNDLSIIQEAVNQLCPLTVEEPATELDFSVEENVEAVEKPIDIVSDVPPEMEAPVDPCAQEPAVTVEETAIEAPTIDSSDITSEETQQIAEEPPEVTTYQSETTEEIPQTTEYQNAEYAPQEPTSEYSPQETEWQPQVTEDIPQDINETPEAPENPEATDDNAEVSEEVSENAEEVADQPEVTEEFSQSEEEMPPATEEISQYTEEQPEIVQETLESMDETPETPDITEEIPEVPQEFSENIADQPEDSEGLPQPEEEMPQVMANEPQTLEETLQSVKETPTEILPSEAPEETPQEISVEVIAEEEQEVEEAAETDEADDEPEYEEL